MNVLTQIRPGTLGLLLFAIMLSTLGTSVFKASQSGGQTPRDGIEAVTKAEVAAPNGKPESENTQAAASSEPELTYFQYQVDVELENLIHQIKAEAKAGLEAGVTAEQVNAELFNLSEKPPNPAVTVQKLVRLRQLQTLKDGEVTPTAEAIIQPTVEGYRDVLKSNPSN